MTTDHSNLDILKKTLHESGRIRHCIDCKRDIKVTGFKKHLRNTHNLSIDEYVIKHAYKGITPTCKACGGEVPRNASISMGFADTCSKECKYIYQSIILTGRDKRNSIPSDVTEPELLSDNFYKFYNSIFEKYILLNSNTEYIRNNTIQLNIKVWE